MDAAAGTGRSWLAPLVVVAHEFISSGSPERLVRTLKIFGAILVASFFIPRGANYSDGVVMSWNLVAATSMTWVTTIYPLLLGLGLLVLASRPDTLAVLGGWALLLGGSVPDMVRAARFLAEDGSPLGMLAAPHSLAWQLGATGCVLLLTQKESAARSGVRLLIMIAGCSYALYLLVPSLANTPFVSGGATGISLPFRILDRSTSFTDGLVAFTAVGEMLLPVAAILVMLRSAAARLVASLVFLVLMVEVAAFPLMQSVAGIVDGQAWIFVDQIVMGTCRAIECWVLFQGMERVTAGMGSPATTSTSPGTAPRGRTVAQAAPAVVPIPANASRLMEIEALFAKGLITEEERREKRQEVLSRI